MLSHEFIRSKDGYLLQNTLLLLSGSPRQFWRRNSSPSHNKKFCHHLFDQVTAVPNHPLTSGSSEGQKGHNHTDEEKYHLQNFDKVNDGLLNNTICKVAADNPDLLILLNTNKSRWYWMLRLNTNQCQLVLFKTMLQDARPSLMVIFHCADSKPKKLDRNMHSMFSHLSIETMELFRDCLCLSKPTTPENVYTEIKMSTINNPSRLDAGASIETGFRIWYFKSHHATPDPDYEVSLYCRLLTHKAYDEMERNPFSTLYNVLAIRLDNRRDLLLQCTVLMTDLHDAFAIVRRFLDSWRLPCIAVIWPDDNSITGISLLAIGSTAPVNWLHSLLGNGELMVEYFCYAGLHFTEDSRSTVVTPRHWPPNTPAPANTLRTCPHTQVRVLPTCSRGRPLTRWPSQEVLDSDSDTVPDGDLELYHRAVVHNYWDINRVFNRVSASAHQPFFLKTQPKMPHSFVLTHGRHMKLLNLFHTV